MDLFPLSVFRRFYFVNLTFYHIEQLALYASLTGLQDTQISGKTILDVLLRVFQEEISIQVYKLVKQMDLSNVG